MSESARGINIMSLQEEDRPREKFEAQGGGGLTVSELFAILIGSGTADENAVQLMQRIISDCGGSLATLGRMTISDLTAYKGVGKAKAIAILAACELGKRRMRETVAPEVSYNSSKKVYAYYATGKIGDMSVEECHLLLLNQRLCLIGSRLISRGGITGTVVDVRLVLKEAILAGATHIVLCHNHPSGNCRPSGQDDNLTRRVKKVPPR